MYVCLCIRARGVPLVYLNVPLASKTPDFIGIF
jgi:hypothetical protein